MSDNKKYYYMKVKENFFDTEDMIILESMPDGHLYSNILLKLYLRSLKDNGCLMFKGMIPYTPDILARIVRHNHGVVEKAIDVFKQLGLVEILDNGAIYMMDIQNFIGESSTEADRIRAYRKKVSEQKLLAESSTTSERANDVQMYDKSTPELEIDLELELEPEVVESSTTASDVFRTYQNEIGTPSPIIRQKLEDDIETHGAQTVIDAIEEAVVNNVRKYAYVESILARWHNEGRGSKTDGRPKGPKQAAAHHNLPTLEEMKERDRLNKEKFNTEGDDWTWQ